MAMWLTWEVNQAGNWQPNICQIVGIFLGLAGFVWGVGTYIGVGGLATTAFCGN
jgi:hypothetical protein